MTDEDIGAVIRMEVSRAEASLEKIIQKETRMARGFDKAGESADGMAKRIGTGAAAAHARLQVLLGVAQKIAQTFQEVDERFAKLSRTAGGQNVALSKTLVGLGVQDTGAVARQVRSAQGIASQGEIDSFLGGIGDNLTDRQTVGVAQAFARGGSAVFGNGQTLGGLAGVLGDTNSGDLGDLSVIFRRAAGGEFGNAQSKQFNQLVGLGMGRDQALALMSTFQRRGQGEGLNAIIAELAGGGDLNTILAGGAKSAGARASIAGLGDQVNIIPQLTEEFASVGRRDVVGETLDRTAGSNPAARREIERLRRARSAEIAVNQAADEGLGAAEDARRQALDEFEFAAGQDGSLTGRVSQVAVRLSRSVLGDRATAAAAGVNADVAEQIGREVGKAIQTKSAGN